MKILRNYCVLDGLKIDEKSKWLRRRNMMGTNFRIISEPWAPYTIMNPINEAGDVYEMTGYYAEMWHNLQVMNIHICHYGSSKN